MKRRKGFTLLETIGCTVMMAFIVATVTSVSIAIDDLRAGTRNTVFMSTHNLNCMERVRQMALETTEDILLFYGDDVMGTDDIETEVILEPATWDHFMIYSVTINSRMRDQKQKLTSKYLITNIGGVSYEEEFNPIS